MKRNGFTLVEMLIALAIFGMLTAAGIALLSLSVRTQETADRLLGEVGDIRRAGALLTADLGQAVPRTWRDDTGRARPAFAGTGGGEEALIDLVRGGWENYDGAPRPSLQRVGYRLAEGRLERVAYMHLDGGGSPVVIPVLDGVREVRIRYRDRDGVWRERWAPTDDEELPQAVELIARTESHGAVRQLFLVGPSG